MGTIVSQITSLTFVYSTVYSGADQRKHQNYTSLAFVREFTGDWWIPRTNTVPERKFVTKIQVRYHDPKWRRQQPLRMFIPRFLLFRMVFHVFDAGYRAIFIYCFYMIPESVIELDKIAVNWCTKNTEDLGNSSVRSW